MMTYMQIKFSHTSSIYARQAKAVFLSGLAQEVYDKQVRDLTNQSE